MLTENSLTNPGASGVFHCKVDGMAKTIAGNAPVTGNALYILAGNPERLETASGQLVEKNDEKFEVHGDEMEFVTKNHLEQAAVLNPEHILAPEGPRVDPPHSQTMTGDFTEHNDGDKNY